MRLLVRTWNVCHGRSVPGSHRAFLDEMVGLIATGGPDVVCLQELPVWSLGSLEAWSGMRAVAAVTVPARAGLAARRLTALDPDRIRSALAGQANAVLLSRRLELLDAATIALNPPALRRREAARLSLPRRELVAWGRNARVGQVLRVGVGDVTVVLVNLHLTSAADPRPADAELERATAFAEAFARPGEPVVLCGDLNLALAGSAALPALAAAGYEGAGPGIDHVLTRGLRFLAAPRPWPEQRRRRGAVLLSDHAPVEAEMIRG